MGLGGVRSLDCVRVFLGGRRDERRRATGEVDGVFDWGKDLGQGRREKAHTFSLYRGTVDLCPFYLPRLPSRVLHVLDVRNAHLTARGLCIPHPIKRLRMQAQ